MTKRQQIEYDQLATTTTSDDNNNNNDTLFIAPLEIDQEEKSYDDRIFFTFWEPFVSTMISVPIFWTLARGTVLIYEITGRIWPASFLILHLTVSQWNVVSSTNTKTTTTPSFFFFICWRIAIVVLDSLLYFRIYPTVMSFVNNVFFTDVDGTDIVEYSHYKRLINVLYICGVFLGIFRLFLTSLSVLSNYYYRTTTAAEQRVSPFPTRIFTRFLEYCDNHHPYLSDTGKRKFLQFVRWKAITLFYLSLALLSWTIVSLVVHLGNWIPPPNIGPHCDPLDTTECILPFPSFHYVVSDTSTETGYRINFSSNALPLLKGGVSIDPTYINELDGFSTMAPLLFYMDGLKESVAQQKGNEATTAQLQGPNDIALSVTPNSITLLLDVDKKILVHHSAEIDYMDEAHPLVLVFPAQPLRHNAHYALIVMEARDSNGVLMLPKPGMKELLSNNQGNNTSTRSERYRKVVLPALLEAAEWIDIDDVATTIQLLFDFPTISHESQLGKIKAVRDTTLNQIKTWNWKERVKIVKIQDNDCSSSTQQQEHDHHSVIARTIHGKISVPWFLKDYGLGHRGATLNNEVSSSSSSSSSLIGEASFVIHIPCSVRAAALGNNDDTAKELKAFLDYGHGIFGNRNEATSWSTLLNMANDNGYIITAMDWRGMSRYDLPIVIKSLMSYPGSLVTVRDNIIQGYANKFVLQYFCRSDAMLQMDWMQFKHQEKDSTALKIPTGKKPSLIFYGISQGGILGAGYVALSGPTKLIDRAILGVPGTPFALILSRSLAFSQYDTVMLLNFYHNRHVRIFLNIAQMFWDTCEGSGVLAPPLLDRNTIPPMLLQAGLGDPIVPTIAAEALTRALGGVVLPNNPRTNIFGIPVWNESSSSPNVTLSELLFQREYESLPNSDAYDTVQTDNYVHGCVREDKAFIQQIVQFINTGRIVDVCSDYECTQKEAQCY